MKGMLVKDIRFLLNQKSSLLIFLGLGAFFMLSAEDVSLSMAYTTMMIAIFTTSSISYDGFDNGMAFLMTLPVKRRDYAISKYVFSLAVVLVMGLVICVMALGMNALQLSQMDLNGLPGGFGMSVVFAMVATSVLVPIYLKFGGEKARYAMAAMVGVVFAIGYILKAVAGDLLVSMVDSMNRFAELPPVQAVGITALIVAVVVGVSMVISVNIMEKKEY